MSSRVKRVMRIAVLTAGVAIIMTVSLTFRTVPAEAHVVPNPCDFTTGGGFVLTDSGNHANFGLVGGCKNNGFYGHVNFVDHDTTGIWAGLHVSSTSIDGYFEPYPGSNIRDICGTANTNLFGTVKFRARTEDNSDPNSGGKGVDKFGLKLTGVSPPYTGATGTPVTVRFLAGGDIELHKPNPSNTGASTDEIIACGSDDGGLGS